MDRDRDALIRQLVAALDEAQAYVEVRAFPRMRAALKAAQLAGYESNVGKSAVVTDKHLQQGD